MALEVNGVLINTMHDKSYKPLDKDNPYVQFYYECMVKLHKKFGRSNSGDNIFNNEVRIIGTPVYKSRARSDKGLLQENFGTVRWGNMETRQEKGTSATWCYYDSKTVVKDQPDIYKVDDQYFRGAMRFVGENAKWEEAFFMIFIHPYCVKIKEFDGLQSPKTLNPAWFIDDAQARIDIATQRNKQLAEVSRFVYGEADEGTLRDMAGVGDMDISGSSTMNLDALQSVIYDKITKDKELLSNFNREKYNKEGIRIRALLTGMKDEDLLMWKKPFRTWNYKEHVSDTTTHILCTVSKDIQVSDMMQVTAFALRYLKNNPDEELKLDRIYKEHMAVKEAAAE